MIEAWVFGFGANAIVSIAYLAIALRILLGVGAAGQWRKNPLAVATGAIFLSCGLGHGVHPVHVLLLYMGADPIVGDAARTELADWHTWLFDGATAVIALWYFSLRGRFPALVRGAGLFEDMRERQRQALEIHDNIVQGLVKAKMSYEFGDRAAGEREIEETLHASRKIMSDLLGDPDPQKPLAPGDLVRRERPT